MSNKKDEFDIIIDPTRLQKEYFKDLFRYRELFYFFAWREIIVRYKEALLGFIWALVRPLLNMAVFVLVFGKIANLASPGINYPLFVLSGLLPWQLFTNSAMDSSNSLVLNGPLISKVYFPRIILPVNHIIVSFVDFLISLGLLSTLFIYMGAIQSWGILLLPFVIGLNLLLCLGVGLWLSALTIRFRDIRFLVPFIVQFGIFISPVGYSSFLVPEAWRWVYFLNPMAGIIEGFRWCCFGVYHPDLWMAIAISAGISVLLLVSGFFYFRKMERVFADLL